jgi:hypothetical protein
MIEDSYRLGYYALPISKYVVSAVSGERSAPHFLDYPEDGGSRINPPDVVPQKTRIIINNAVRT